MLFASFKIYCANSKTGHNKLGVFASINIEQGEIIERCPIIIIERQEMQLLKEDGLLNHVMWDKKSNKFAICLGFGSLYNHSENPNARYQKFEEENLIKFVASKNIKKDEEITVDFEAK